ncbi:MAG: dTDP-glucose 4,6-dehydratase [Candidatus Marinimicrobia bacterium]|nr:dTDP-glucose 4,6-dehydratase [Candidatus Neomarinimicrobiota bacterium]|tara:strand:+ start:687 stop:1676 length:990 start_codon:yes stop_codon:yes gene_type:complete
MRLLVTGGLGFIGSNFILKLLSKTPDLKILNVDAELHGSNPKNLEGLNNSENYEFVKGNISNKKFMEEQISKCDLVVNFAAESHVDRSINDANPFLVSNIRGAFTILDIITKQKKRMIQVSTDEVFGSLTNDTATELSKFNPSSPYAATKASAELIINSYFTTYNSDVIITRCTNNYGPRQFAEKLIPKTIILANKNQKIPIYGNGSNIRDWIYVDDHCDAIEMALFRGKSGDSYNISADNEVNNLTIVKKILEIMNKSDDLINFVEDRPGHDYRYSMSSKKVSNELDWNVKTSFDEGLEKTIHWYLDNPEILNDTSQKVLDSTPWRTN